MNTAAESAPTSAAFSVYRLLPALALAAGIAVSLFAGPAKGRFILPLEVFADLFIVFFAFRQGSAGARWWRVAAAALLAGDSLYLIGHQVQAYPAWAFMLQETCYTLARFMTAAYLLSNLPPWRELEPAEKGLLLAACAAISFISVQYLLIPIFRSGIYPELFFRVNAVFNRLAESGVFPLALLLGMKARTRYWLYMTHGVALISISSIAIGSYMATNRGATEVPVQEYGWLLGLLIVLAAQAFNPAEREPFAGWKSARVRLVWLVLVFNISLLGGLYLIQDFIGQDVMKLASLLFVFFGLWLVANLISFKISGDINLLLDGVDGSAPAARRPAYRVAILEAELFARKLEAAYDTIRSQARAAALSSLAAQVAHDIRSPLAALDAALADVQNLSEEKGRLIRGAAGRIRDIADDLLEKNRRGCGEGEQAAHGGLKTLALADLVPPVITEKRLQYRSRPGIKIEAGAGADSRELFICVDPVEFSRALSNLVNNSVEALERGGTVKVSAAQTGGRAEIKVRDDGKGIAPEVLPLLGRRGATHGKEGGSGLGLHHARSVVEAWHGTLTIASSQGGTEVTISLPLAAPCAQSAGPVLAALLDDDDLVLLNWRAAARTAGADLRAYKEPAAFLAAVEALPRATPLYLDSDLGGGASGEELAAALHGKGFTDITLATGHPPEKFAALPWLKIRGKEPPWPRPA